MYPIPNFRFFNYLKLLSDSEFKIQDIPHFLLDFFYNPPHDSGGVLWNVRVSVRPLISRTSVRISFPNDT